MINEQKPGGCQFETPFDHIQDINELVLAARAYWAEKNEMSPELMDDDTGMILRRIFSLRFSPVG
jgi:hypothetical protein